MDISEEISTIVRRNLDVFYETEAMDSAFRFQFDAEQRRAKAPWIMMGREQLASDELAVWRKLDRGDLSREEALAEMRALMATYYDQ